MKTLQLDSQDQYQAELANQLSALIELRAYALAVDNTDLSAGSGAIPSGLFNTLNNNLNTIKNHANYCTNTLIPQMNAVPNSLVTCGQKFGDTANQILGLWRFHEGTSIDSDMKEAILDLLGTLKGIVNEQKSNIQTLHSDFSTFQVDADGDLTQLVDNVNDIQNQVNADKNVISQLNSDIAEAKSRIASDRSLITKLSIAQGLSAAAGCGILGFGGMFIGGMVSGGLTDSIYRDRQDINNAQNTIARDQAQLPKERQYITSLTVVQSSMNDLATLNRNMKSSLNEIADWWQSVETKLSNILEDIQDASLDSNWDWLKDDVNMAKQEWQNLLNFATNMQNISQNAEVKVFRAP
ncbi:MAG: HBL/NHE enterotoxin family protein [Cyanobacteria bacterium SBLK]|nr:HBL/NHE enterotoxin family protein [Cyanobacteria bacterium SBLK]